MWSEFPLSVSLLLCIKYLFDLRIGHSNRPKSISLPSNFSWTSLLFLSHHTIVLLPFAHCPPSLLFQSLNFLYPMHYTFLTPSAPPSNTLHLTSSLTFSILYTTLYLYLHLYLHFYYQELNLGGCKRVEDLGLQALALGCSRLEVLLLAGCDAITGKGLRALLRHGKQNTS